MSTQLIQRVADQQMSAKEIDARPHILVYGWIYMFFAALTALAIYVLFTFPQSEI